MLLCILFLPTQWTTFEYWKIAVPCESQETPIHPQRFAEKVLKICPKDKGGKKRSERGSEENKKGGEKEDR